MKKEKNKKTKKNWWKRSILVVWLIFFLGLGTFYLYIRAVSANMFHWFGDLPSYKQLENPTNDLSSELIAADGVSLGKYFRTNRSQVDYREISPNMINALEAVEDVRFREHAGVDLRGLTRAITGAILGRDGSGGGSTLTQQLAKNLFGTRGQDFDGAIAKKWPKFRIFIQKTKEWIVAVQLEKSYTKDEIITMYLNTVEFGSNAAGIKVASQTFFAKGPDSLNILESALLAGIVQAPTRHNPILNPEGALSRRNTVLFQMKKYGKISQDVYDSLKNQPITLDYKVDSHNRGLATYFRSVAGNYLRRWARENGYDLYEDGLKIYTTIDSKMQLYAEQAVAEHMSELQEVFYKEFKGKNPWLDDNGREIPGFVMSQMKKTGFYKGLEEKYKEDTDSIKIVLNTPKNMSVFSWEGSVDTLMTPMDSLKHYLHFLHAGFLSMDPHTGDIKAWVGGINHTYFQYDHVLQGKRQPGSTFKPIVYTAAIDNGYSPCFTVVDAPVSFKLSNGDTWTPKNADNKYTGEKMTLRQAMARSVNSITAEMMKRIGPQTVVDYGHRLGIQSPLDPVPALCLGASDVSVYELVGTYGTFVNDGYWIMPSFLTRIEDKYGNVLQEFPSRTQQAISPATAYTMLHMLKGATEEKDGTATGLSRELRQGNEIGAKTGTTSNYSDGWFMGVTKDLVSGVWVGGEDIHIHFNSLRYGQGARMAMPIWEKYMLKIYADSTLSYTKGPFPRPDVELPFELNCTLYPSDSTSTEADSIAYQPVELKAEDAF